ncbi:MAG: RNB domain-containing ribonuclease [Bacilli bacterium]|nr:RNB domain-containing ribonuclease [Bacilli bacterium]
MSNNEYRKILLRDKINNDKLKSLFLYDFDNIIDNYFGVLLNIINGNNKKNLYKIDNLMSFIKNNITIFNKEKLDSIVFNFLDLKNMIDNGEVILKINKLLDEIYYENTFKYREDMSNTLNYLIYEDKNIRRLKKFLNDTHSSFFNTEYFDNIIVTLLDKFNLKDRELKKYYYRVVILLLSKISNNLLTKNKDKYLVILDELKVHSEYTDSLYDLVSGVDINDDVLLDRFNVKSSFPYKYEGVGVIYNDDSIPNLKQRAITIDSNNTMKRDDAIYFKKNKDNTYTLYVHVSFIPALVSFDSDINKEARNRYKSLYVFDNLIPMLPNDLTINNCSLSKNNYRNAVSYSVKVDKDMNIIPDTFKITRTNIKVGNNYSYEDIDYIIRDNRNDDFGNMIRYLTVFSLNSSNGIDVDRALKDINYYKRLVNGNNDISKDIVSFVMRNINYLVAKYFKDREIPYLYKYSYFREEDYFKFYDVVSRNDSFIKYDYLVKDMKKSFFDIKLSNEPKSFFDFDCYSSSTDPLWKYSSLYNQYLTDKFIFCKNNDTDSIDEWYNKTGVLAEELNYKKENNKDIETLCKSLVKIRSRY